MKPSVLLFILVAGVTHPAAARTVDCSDMGSTLGLDIVPPPSGCGGGAPPPAGGGCSRPTLRGVVPGPDRGHHRLGRRAQRRHLGLRPLREPLHLVAGHNPRPPRLLRRLGLRAGRCRHQHRRADGGGRQRRRAAVAQGRHLCLAARRVRLPRRPLPGALRLPLRRPGHHRPLASGLWEGWATTAYSAASGMAGPPPPTRSRSPRSTASTASTSTAISRTRLARLSPRSTRAAGTSASPPVFQHHVQDLPPFTWLHRSSRRRWGDGRRRVPRSGLELR